MDERIAIIGALVESIPVLEQIESIQNDIQKKNDELVEIANKEIEIENPILETIFFSLIVCFGVFYFSIVFHKSFV